MQHGTTANTGDNYASFCEYLVNHLKLHDIKARQYDGIACQSDGFSVSLLEEESYFPLPSGNNFKSLQKGEEILLTFDKDCSLQDVDFACSTISSESDISHTPKSAIEAMKALRNWRFRSDTPFPYAKIMSAYHSRGKHFVNERLLAALADARANLAKIPGAQKDEKIKGFLDVALDKYDEKYDFISYCALNILPIPLANEDEAAKHADREYDRQIVCLIVDILCFEYSMWRDPSRFPRLLPPELKVFEKRCRSCLKAISANTSRLGFELKFDSSPICEQLDNVIEQIPDEFRSVSEDRLAISIQPVYVIHDEYMFIRILQTFETHFAWIVKHLTKAIRHFDVDLVEALKELESANRILRELSLKFSILSTMRPDSFRTFRTYTEGASAIQSINYKRIESLCREPPSGRLNSAAYDAVPNVKTDIISGQKTIDQCIEICRALPNDPSVLEKIEEQMSIFSSGILAWRKTHFHMAVKMLGEGTGTGNTSGTPYLDEARNIPVFETL